MSKEAAAAVAVRKKLRCLFSCWCQCQLLLKRRRGKEERRGKRLFCEARQISEKKHYVAVEGSYAPRHARGGSTSDAVW
jgi:hypothetical protein